MGTGSRTKHRARPQTTLWKMGLQGEKERKWSHRQVKGLMSGARLSAIIEH